MSGQLYLRWLRSLISGNRRQLLQHRRRLRPGLVEAVIVAQRRFIERARRELAARGRRVVDGHGDLRAEHVFLGPPVGVIDCLEFDAQLRRLDPPHDLALLVLEIERLGDARRAAAVYRAYRAGAHDDISDAALHFYVSLTATTRAKLAAWHIGDPQFPRTRPWIERARDYLHDARAHIGAALALLDRPSAGSATAAVGWRPVGQQWRERQAGVQPRESTTE